MAAVTFTAADIRPLNGAITRRFNTGGTVDAGKGVYIAADGDVEHADADDVAQAQARGIACANQSGGTSFAAGERIDVVLYGPVAGFTGLTPGLPVYVSPTAGALDQTASATTGDFNYIIGYAESATTIFVCPQMVVPTAVS